MTTVTDDREDPTIAEADPTGEDAVTPVTSPTPQDAGSSRLPWVVAAATTVLALVFAVLWITARGELAPLQEQEAAREESVLISTTVFTRLTNWTGGELDAIAAELALLGTEEFGREVGAFFVDPFLNQSLTDDIVSTGRILELFVQDVDLDDPSHEGRATVFAVAQQQVSSGGATPLQFFNYFDLELLRVDGEWLVNSVDLIQGPQEAPATAGS